MIDKLLSLKTTKPWLFYLLIPVTVVVGVLTILSRLNSSGAKKDVEEAREKDYDLKEEQNEALGASKELKKQSDEIEAKIQENRNSDPDLDWHKRK